MTRKSFLIFILSCTVALMMSTAAFSAPIVSYSVSGSSGNWTLDFSVTNTLGVNNLDIYMFGVELPQINQQSPTPNWTAFGNFNPSVANFGPNIDYGTTWWNYKVSIPDMIQNGETLSGFDVNINTLDAPTSVLWFAAALDWTGGQASYPGTDYYYSATNPGFSGTGTDPVPTSVPEPATFLLVGAGLAGLAVLRKRSKI